MKIDIRLEVNDVLVAEEGERSTEDLIIHEIITEIPDVKSAVILRNDGFANILPDESTRQER